ncbi:MAG: MFS transporter [Sphaerochaetaceae bacterium]|nr:MFS transporter [Sphaerochaetaceae bacterium]
MSGRIGKRDWTLIWVLGMAGQLCWHVENSVFNTFVYQKVSPNPSIVSWMLAISATATTISTFLFGTLSDRKARRKCFLVWGYILWAAFTALFGLAQFLPQSSVVLVAAFCVGCDGIMSFFGSMGYDCAFNAWTTDLTDDTNRGQIGGALAVLPVIATIVGTLISGIIIDSIGFFAFFIVMGALVAICGFLASAFMKDQPIEPNKDPKGFAHQFFSVFNFSIVKRNRELFWVFLVLMVYFIGFNVYYPYLNIFFVNYLGYDLTTSGIIQGIGLLAACALTPIASRFINANRMSWVILISLCINFLGVVLITSFSTLAILILGTFFAGIGYVLVLQSLTAWMKGLYPEDQRGQFEGVKIIFFVLVPMIVAPMINAPVIRKLGVEMVIDGKIGMVPDSDLFWVAGCLMMLSLVPLIPASRLMKSRLAISAKA